MDWLLAMLMLLVFLAGYFQLVARLDRRDQGGHGHITGADPAAPVDAPPAGDPAANANQPVNLRRQRPG